jgi:inner membrane protein
MAEGTIEEKILQLKTRKRELVSAVLSAIYGVLYLILKAEDFALLGGTLLLVVALTVTMYFTRRIHQPTGA